MRSTLSLADAWGVPHDLVGVFVLAGLTGLPNAYAAARLALQGRGPQVVSEAFNSNTINLLVGIGLPALVIGLGRTGHNVPLDLAWLLGLTVLVLLARQGGLSRWELFCGGRSKRTSLTASSSGDVLDREFRGQALGLLAVEQTS